MVQNLTKGTAWKQIVLLAVPLLLGNIFQASYNLIDTMIVGRYVGPDALAGVGIASPIFNLLNAFLMGLSLGASILISQLFGAGKSDKFPITVATILWSSLLFAVVLTIIGQLLTTPFLMLLDTPKEDFPYAEIYLRTILCGLICNVFYNQLTGMLRGLGNTKVPLYILILSCCINTGLDIVFVCILDKGVEGAGIATIIAEGLSAVLTYFYIQKYVPQLRTYGNYGFSKEVFLKTFKLGLPIGLQQASISLGHVFMQGIINPFGTELIAGYTAASKIDTFAVMPIISLGSALSTFSAQNVGAQNYRRIQKGYCIGCGITMFVCFIVCMMVVPFRTFWIQIFVSVQQYPQLASKIMVMGAEMLAVTPLFYWILGLIHVTLNTMAGAGDTVYSMVSMIFMMLLRVLIAWMLVDCCGMDQFGIWWAFPLSWLITLCMAMIHFCRGNWKKKTIAV